MSFKPNTKYVVCGDARERPDQGVLRSPTAKTADYTALQSDAGKLFTNTGAAGAVNFTLPAATTDGTTFDFFMTTAQVVTITATGGAKINGSGANGNMSALATQAVFGRVRVVAMGGNWFATASGTWTTT